MRSGELRVALRGHLDAVSARLQSELAGGVEVPFELEQHGGRSGSRAALYCYRPLTREFIAAREPALRALPSHHDAMLALADFDGLERYLLAMGVDLAPAAGAARVHAALAALIEEVFEEQSDFELRPERLEAALARLESSATAAPTEVTLLATLHGMAIGSRELAITGGLRITRADDMTGLPPFAPAAGAGAGCDADGEHEHLLVLLEEQHEEPRRALQRGRELLGELLRALRLFGDGRISLGTLGWMRVGDGAWHPCTLGGGGRPQGILLVSEQHEDELRAFCNLIARRTPGSGPLAWALRRFELGCERPRALEGLSDHLLALRALLDAEPGQQDLLPRRLAALCAVSEEREQLYARACESIELERALRAGVQPLEPVAAEQLAEEISAHLRALLRDVICGHLQPSLAALAEELAGAGAGEEQAGAGVGEELAGAGEAGTGESQADSPLSSLEQILGDPRQAVEILDVLI